MGKERINGSEDSEGSEGMGDEGGKGRQKLEIVGTDLDMKLTSPITNSLEELPGFDME